MPVTYLLESHVGIPLLASHVILCPRSPSRTFLLLNPLFDLCHGPPRVGIDGDRFARHRFDRDGERRGVD